MLDTVLLIAVVLVLLLGIFSFPFILSKALNDVRDSFTPPAAMMGHAAELAEGLNDPPE